MKITKATAKYEAWVAKQTPLINADIALKHRRMAEAPFPFLRATYYRWAQLWPEVCPDLTAAPSLLAVADLHIENFGTWRDSDGRLIWGINDFDEACPLAYTNDLVRLATSAQLAIAGNHLALTSKMACDAILSGYGEALNAGGRPFVLEEHHGWLRTLALGELRDPVWFWGKLDGLATYRGTVPKLARKALAAQLPASGLRYRIVHRTAGLGSLGRQRFVALADWGGGEVAREAKPLMMSASVWAGQHQQAKRIWYQRIIGRAVRVPDPSVCVRSDWLVRRLAPHCSRIELDALPAERDEAQLLHAAGWETANVHFGSAEQIAAVRADLRKRKAGWLHAAASDMAKAVVTDWGIWRATRPAQR